VTEIVDAPHGGAELLQSSPSSALNGTVELTRTSPTSGEADESHRCSKSAANSCTLPSP
jgi:hypothetical protein